MTRMTYFEHPYHGTLVVLDMADIDNLVTDDISLAMQVLCPLPNGKLLIANASEGKLTRVKALH